MNTSPTSGHRYLPCYYLDLTTRKAKLGTYDYTDFMKKAQANRGKYQHGGVYGTTVDLFALEGMVESPSVGQPLSSSSFGMIDLSRVGGNGWLTKAPASTSARVSGSFSEAMAATLLKGTSKTQDTLSLSTGSYQQRLDKLKELYERAPGW